jgi:hypothetical protein
MADDYIDLFECRVYGELACQEMRARLLPLHPDWGAAILRGIALQEAANQRVIEVAAQAAGPKVNEAEVAEVRDTIVRFGSWLQSLKGRPLDLSLFFGVAAPSTVSRRRLPKLTGSLASMIEELTPHAEGASAIPGAAGWLTELREAHAIALRNQEARSSAKASRIELAPHAEEARQAWLARYLANKRLAEGILRHDGEVGLMPVIFDDLAEVQRSKVSSDEQGSEGEDALDPLVTGPAPGRDQDD